MTVVALSVSPVKLTYTVNPSEENTALFSSLSNPKTVGAALEGFTEGKRVGAADVGT